MPITDPFQSHATSLDAPINDGFAIVPDDGADLAVLTRAIMVGGGGDVAVTLAGGTEVTFRALAPGAVYPFRVTRVRATGTSATDILGLY